MSYTSLSFIVFIALVLLLYYIVGCKGQLYILVIANLVFYGMAGIKYLPFMITTACVIYIGGVLIGKIYISAEDKIIGCIDSNEKKRIRADAKKKAKRVLLFVMLVTIGLLIICKYTIFVLQNVNNVLAMIDFEPIPLFKVILPLGVSFYTFMALSYILDIYWKRYKAEKNFFVFLAYLTYFPHVVQGPIDRFNEFKAQIEKGIAISYQNLTFGAQLAIWGFFKKLVIADRVGLFVDNVFENLERLDGSIIIIALAVYSIQIYADFSGCIDIVTGVSEMFGIKLRKNFNHPYFSRTMPEFWRRWHISLQEWFKDYVYFPVSSASSTKKVKKFLLNKNQTYLSEVFVTCFPILVVWMITGIWHGASWNYVVWGIYHATLLIGSSIFGPIFKKMTRIMKIDTENFGWYFWQILRTYILCCVGRIFFRAPNLKSAFIIIDKVFTDVSVAALFNKVTYGIDRDNIIVAFVAVVVLLVVDILQEKIHIREALAKQNLVFRWIIIYAGIISIVIFGMYGPGYDASGFIYQQF